MLEGSNILMPSFGVVCVARNGSIDALASALTHLILDIPGYFAP